MKMKFEKDTGISVGVKKVNLISTLTFDGKCWSFNGSCNFKNNEKSDSANMVGEQQVWILGFIVFMLSTGM